MQEEDRQILRILDGETKSSNWEIKLEKAAHMHLLELEQVQFFINLNDTARVRFFLRSDEITKENLVEGENSTNVVSYSLCVKLENGFIGNHPIDEVGVSITVKDIFLSSRPVELLNEKYFILQKSSSNAAMPHYTVVQMGIIKFSNSDKMVSSAFTMSLCLNISVTATELHSFSKYAPAPKLTLEELFLKQIGGLFHKSTENFSDVILISSDGGEHKAHRFLLAARSSVLRDLLLKVQSQAEYPCFEGKINLADVNDKTLGVMLHWMYTGELQEDAMDCMKDLLYAALHYELQELLDILDYKLIEICKTENMKEVFELYQIAEENCMPNATKEIAEFISRNIQHETSGPSKTQM